MPKPEKLVFAPQLSLSLVFANLAKNDFKRRIAYKKALTADA